MSKIVILKQNGIDDVDVYTLATDERKPEPDLEDLLTEAGVWWYSSEHVTMEYALSVAEKELGDANV